MTSARNLPDWEGEFALGAALEQALGTRTRLGNDVQVANRRRGRARQSRRLGQGTGPPFVGKRIEELCRGKEAAEIDLRALTPGRVDSGPAEGAEKLLARLPDVGDAL